MFWVQTPVVSNYMTLGRDTDSMGKLFLLFCFVLTLSSLFGTPENARFLWATQKAGFRHPILILSPLVM